MKKCFNIFKTMGRKNLILSLLALVLVIVLLTGTTFSWIENITSVQIVVDESSKNDTALVTAKDLDGTVVIAKGTTNAIDLGSYFYESGNMHLSACSGDGELFYFNNLTKNAGDVDDTTTIDSWRMGTADDENTAYLSVTFDVSSPDATTDYWFDNIPVIESVNGDALAGQNVCYSVTVDGKTNVYSSSKNNYYKVADVSGRFSITPTTVHNAKNYTHDETNNEDYKNVLFTVKKGQTKRVNLKVWLQYTDDTVNFAGTEVHINMILASSWAYTRTIYFEDCTNDKAPESFNWATSDGREEFFLKIRNEDTYYKMTRLSKDKSDDGYHKLYVEIPAAYNDINVAFLRCNGEYDSGDEGKEVDGIECWNKWTEDTTLPAGAADATFYALGGGDDNGTWEEVEQIWLVDAGYLVVSEGEYNGDVRLYDKSYVSDQIMCKTDNYGVWTTFVRSASTNIDFQVSGSACVEANRTLGYTNDGDVKESKDTYYIIDSVKNGKAEGYWSEDKFTAASGYYLLGESESYEDWTMNKNTQMYYQDAARADGGEVVYTTVELEEGPYKFKILRANCEWFTNVEDTIDDTVTGFNLSDTDESHDNCTLNAKGGTYLFVFNKSTKELNVHKIPTMVEDGYMRTYVLHSQSISETNGNPYWFNNMWNWNDNGYSKSAAIHWVQDGYVPSSYISGTSSAEHKIFWVDLYENATHIEWQTDSGNLPSGGFEWTPSKDYMYALNSNKGAYFINSTAQNVPTLNVSSESVELGESVTLSYTGDIGKGLAGFGSYVAYYVTDENGNTYNVDSTWLPKAKGTYTVTLRAHDGYILTDASPSVTVKVK